MGPALLWPLELFGELFDATLDIPLEVVSSLVLRNDAKHLPQTLKALARVAGLAECSLRGLVLGREVSRHDSVPPGLGNFASFNEHLCPSVGEDKTSKEHLRRRFSSLVRRSNRACHLLSSDLLLLLCRT